MANLDEGKCEHKVPLSQFCPECQDEIEDEFNEDELDDYGVWDDEDDDDDDWLEEDDDYACRHNVPWDKKCKDCVAEMQSKLEGEL